MKRWNTTAAKAVPLVAATALVLAACGGDGDSEVAQASIPVADVPAAPAQPQAPEAPAAAPDAAEESAPAPAKGAQSAPAPAAPGTAKSKEAAAPVAKGPKGQSAKSATAGSEQLTKIKRSESKSAKAANQKIYDQKNGATDFGVTRDGIKLGSINMHGMALGNVLTAPMVRGNLATATAVNDRGGALGRRLSIVDCDDGPGEVSRAKAFIKKLAGQDKVFTLLTGVGWATASIHDDLKQFKLPYVGAWAYSQTEWQDPYMFPTHMSMIHEAMAGANWVKNVVKPQTYGLICLTSPEMQLACREVAKIMDASGAKLVKKADVSISETSMSATVLAMRAAAPEHIVHYVINPATMAKFMGWSPPTTRRVGGTRAAGPELSDPRSRLLDEAAAHPEL